MLKIVFERIRVALRVLWDGEEVFYEEIRKRIKGVRDLEYLAMIEQNQQTAKIARDAIKERDLAVETMHMVTNDALKVIKELEKQIANTQNKAKDPFDGLLSLHRPNKDDLPN